MSVAPTLAVARVSRVNRGAYEILTATGETLHAEPTGALLYRAQTPLDLPAVGDWVNVDILADSALIHTVLPRRTAFIRRAAGTREEPQIIAANIDIALVVCGLDGDFNPRRLERYVTLTREAGAEPIIVLNKSDLCDDVAARVAEATAACPAVRILTAQATTPAGIAAVAACLAAGRTLALLGSSGAGKSTLVNQLLGTALLDTREVRSHDSRGRHTTTFRQLIPLPSGAALIDTPGLREIQLWATQDSLDAAFADIAALAARCRYRDCAHSAEPGCAVAAALLDGSLDTHRWTSYRKLQGEILRHQEASDHVAARARKQELKTLHRAMRRFQKGR